MGMVTSSPAIDLNCDVGERENDAGIRADIALMQTVTSVNMACGGHAGTSRTMNILCNIAVERQINIGAQVSYVDREGFGRRRLDIPMSVLQEQLIEQWGALSDAAKQAGGGIGYMRPHGALYNAALHDVDTAATIVEVTPAGYPIVCLPTSALAKVAAAQHHPVIPEFFVDRQVAALGRLVPRSEPEAVISETSALRARLRRWIREGTVTTRTGEQLIWAADTICLHSDTPGADDHAQSIAAVLTEEGVKISPFPTPISARQGP